MGDIISTVNMTYGKSSFSGFFGGICSLIIIGILIAALWKIYVKAGKPGWAVLIPFYGNYCQFDIIFGNGWLFLLLFVPLVNAVVLIMMFFKLAAVFGKGIGFGFGLMFLPFIFVPILGFGDAEYIGPQ